MPQTRTHKRKISATRRKILEYIFAQYDAARGGDAKALDYLKAIALELERAAHCNQQKLLVVTR